MSLVPRVITAARSHFLFALVSSILSVGDTMTAPWIEACGQNEALKGIIALQDDIKEKWSKLEGLSKEAQYAGLKHLAGLPPDPGMHSLPLLYTWANNYQKH